MNLLVWSIYLFLIFYFSIYIFALVMTDLLVRPDSVIIWPLFLFLGLISFEYYSYNDYYFAISASRSCICFSISFTYFILKWKYTFSTIFFYLFYSLFKTYCSIFCTAGNCYFWYSYQVLILLITSLSVQFTGFSSLKRSESGWVYLTLLDIK